MDARLHLVEDVNVGKASQKQVDALRRARTLPWWCLRERLLKFARSASQRLARWLPYWSKLLASFVPCC